MKKLSIIFSLFGALFFCPEAILGQMIVIDNHSSNPSSPQIIQVELNDETEAGVIVGVRLRYIPDIEQIIEMLCELEAEQYQAGDLDHNGEVNITDALLFISLFGTEYGSVPGCNFPGSVASLEQLKFDLTSEGDFAWNIDSDDPGSVCSSLTLLINGDEIDTEYIDQGQGAVIFSDIDYEFEYNNELLIELKAEFDQMQNQYVPGTSFSVDIVDAVVEDDSGDNISEVIIKQGTGGNNFYLFSSYANLIYSGSLATVGTFGNEIHGHYEIIFFVEAVGDDIQIPATVNDFFSIDSEVEEILGLGGNLNANIENLIGADLDDYCFTIGEGDFAVFKITCDVDPWETGYHKLKLKEFYFSYLSGAVGSYYPVELLEDFITPTLWLEAE